jgi:tetratricopeptide (TPR) repeat protein
MKKQFPIFPPLLRFSFFAIFLLIFSCSSPQEEMNTHLESAKKYFRAGEFEKAKIEYQNAVQLAPENDAAHFDLGETYVHLQDPAKAAASFSQAIKANPDNLRAQLRLGQILLLANATKQARETVNKILEKRPDNVEAMHLLSSIQIQERNLPLALKTLEKAIPMAPSDPRTSLFLAHLLYAMDRLDQAESYYLKTIELDNTLRAPYIELAQLYKKKGKIEKIEPLITQWVKIPGDPVQKSHDLGQFQESRKNFEQAEKTYLDASINAPEDSRALVNLASFYARQKQNNKALEIFNRALALNPQNLDIQTQIATLAFEEKKYKQAESAVDAVLIKTQNHEQANYLKGLLYFNRQEVPSALKHFDLVVSQAPNHARARFFKARCLLDKGRSDLPGQDLFRVAAGYMTAESWERNLAKEELLKVLQIDPEFVNARLLLIDIYLGSQELGPARKNIAAILQREPRNIQALILAGKLKLLEKDLGAAEKIYLAILEMRPEYAAGHVSLGVALYGLGKTPAALDALDKALGINPNQMDALNYKVSIFMQKKEVPRALEACSTHREKFKQDDPSLAIIDLIEGKIFRTTGNLDKASLFFTKALERVPTLLAPHEELAMIAEYQRDIPRAIEHYERLLALNPDYLPTYLNLSRIYKTQGDLKKAQSYLRNALSIKSDFAPAANNLAFILAETKTALYEALRLAKTARDKDPKNPDYLDTLGWIYYLQGSNDLALRELKDSLEINPDNPITHYHMGWAYYDTQKFEAARTHMAKALELNPDFNGADKARNVLGE